MRSRFLIMLAFASILTACSSDSESINDVSPVSKNNPAVTMQQPVSFGAYVNRATTRAGAEGVLTTNGADEGQLNLHSVGFGVLAYYTDDKPYSANYNPNFMYNTKVSGENWTYSPLRYWPNENGTDNENEGFDRVSFFAYAPHVVVDPATGFVDENDSPDSGITRLSRNGEVGDPMLFYRVNFNPAKQVDFCWGTPRVNMTKQGVNQKVEFEFNHALAALNVQIDAVIDEFVPGGNALPANTNIFVRSVSFEGFADKGSFNLNTPADRVMWYDATGCDYIDGGKVTVHDGRSNGFEGVSASMNELPQGLNHNIVQSARYGETALSTGVTNNAVNLFDNTSIEAPIYVIPSGQPLKVTIVYDVETAVDNLPGYLSDGVTHGTSIENSITASIFLNSGEYLRLEAGKKYKLNLHLGLASMKFDTNVGDWDPASTANVDAPINDVEMIHVSDVTLTPTSLPLHVGETGQLSATVSPSDATDKKIIWSSADDNIATVSDEGLVTAISNGVVTITAKAEDGGIEKTCTVTVTTPATGVTLPPTYTLNKSQTYTFQNVVIPTTASNQAVTWESSDPSVATIDPNSGLITAVGGGDTNITATLVEGEQTFTATCVLTVKVPVTGVSLNITTLDLPLFRSQALTATVEPLDADIQNVTWQSSAPTIVSVDNNGNIKALQASTAPVTITVTTEDGVKTAECVVTVVAPDLYTSLSQLSESILDGTFNTEDASCYVGNMYVQPDGTLTASKTGAVGVIAYISTNGTNVDAAITDSRILVLSLQKNGWVKLGPNNNYIGKEGYAMGLEKGDDSSYPAIYNTWHYGSNGGYGITGETGAKGHWFLPSRTQMELMGARAGDYSDPWKSIVSLSTTDQCWSSTERYDGFMNLFLLLNGSAQWQTGYGKMISAWAVPVFAY